LLSFNYDSRQKIKTAKNEPSQGPMILLIVSQSMSDFLELLVLKEGVDQFIQNNFSPAGKTC